MNRLTGTRIHDGAWMSDSDLANAVLVTCEVCGVPGPARRYDSHRRIDHQGAKTPEPYVLAIPGRFRPVLERMEAISVKQGARRTPAQMVTLALDEWLDGRKPAGMRRRVFEHTHWGADE